MKTNVLKISGALALTILGAVLASLYLPTGTPFTVRPTPIPPRPVMEQLVSLMLLVAGLAFVLLQIIALVLGIRVLSRVLRYLQAWERQGDLPWSRSDSPAPNNV
jgi:hypothetical protein